MEVIGGDGDCNFEQLEKKVTKWAKMLTNEEKIEHALKRLDRVPINLQLLSCTGVGKAVNALRRHNQWGEKASGMVARWKEVAKAETARAAAEAEEEREEEDEEEEAEREGSRSEEEEDDEDGKIDQREEKAPLVIRIRKDKPRPEEARRKRRGEEEDGAEERDDGLMDAFSAQLAAADKAAKKSAKKPKKITRISAESIQSSLMESLKNPTLIGAQQKQQCMFADPNINMFKAPKEKKRIYAGRRKPTGPGTAQEVPRLFDICMRFLLNNIDAIDETGNIPFDVLKPVLEKANAEQLMRLEKKNPYFREDTGYLWKIHCKRDFGKELANLRDEEGEMDSEDEDQFGEDEIPWRRRYKKFLADREQRLKRLSSQIKSHISETVQPQRQAMVTAPIAPRHVRKRQMQHGIRVAASQVPSAVELTRARRQIFENGNDADLRNMPAAIRNATPTLRSDRPKRDDNPFSSSSSSSSSAKKKPQRGPLMLKTLRMLKKQKR